MKQEQVREVMNDRLAQELLNSNIPARLAYIGSDGFPRAIPIGFLWDGTQFVIGTATNSPKMRALRANPKVALTIDTNTILASGCWKCGLECSTGINCPLFDMPAVARRIWTAHQVAYQSVR